MPGLIGKKIGMTNIYAEDGRNIPVTVLEVGPCKVLNVKTKEKDGYDALQLCYGEKRESRSSKPVIGQYKKNNLPVSAVLREFRNFEGEHASGEEISVELFKEGELVKVTGRSKGKGFQGVVKRYGFAGVGGQTHGQSDRQRHGGSMGASSSPSRVFKGQREGGRMGYDFVTVRNLRVVKIMPEKNVILVRGAVPGTINSIVEINK